MPGAQTAAGLAADLRRALTESRRRGRIGEFPLGTHDLPDKLLIPERLYGREREIAILLAAFDRVVGGGGPKLVLISGHAGAGKSTVVNELHRALVPSRGLFASGKFDQNQRDVPYASLAQALQGLVRPLLGKSDAEFRPLARSARHALGLNYRLMATLVPELELLMARSRPLRVPPRDAKRRFHLIIRRLPQCLPSGAPAGAVLDDSGWTPRRSTCWRICVARISPCDRRYRDNESRRRTTYQSASSDRRPVGEWRMRDAAFRLDDVPFAGRCSALRATVPRSRGWHKKSAGNPFSLFSSGALPDEAAY